MTCIIDVDVPAGVCVMIGQNDGGASLGKELSYLLLSDVIRQTLEHEYASGCQTHMYVNKVTTSSVDSQARVCRCDPAVCYFQKKRIPTSRCTCTSNDITNHKENTENFYTEAENIDKDYLIENDYYVLVEFI